VVDATGTPLAALTTAATVNDCLVPEPLLEAIPPVRGPRGRPRRRPGELHADKGHDFDRCRRYLRRRRIGCRIARVGVGSKERLGRRRRGAERTPAWLNRFRRLTVRYARRAGIHRAFPTLGCALIRWGAVERELGPRPVSPPL